MLASLRILQLPALTLAALALAACTPAPPDGGVNDPYEVTNRAVHAFNTDVDRALLRPLGQASTHLPEGIGEAIVTFSDNASLPGMAVNNLLQGNLEDAGANAARFVINTVFGLGGFGDPAAEIGLFERDTDFGETLAVWGFEEGAYVELPLFGPSTERDAAGQLVDILMDPLGGVGWALQRDHSTAFWVGEKIVERGQFIATVDGLLYESADSYAQARLAYLQNRRFEVAGGSAAQDDDAGFVDPFADFVDPFAELE
ncbi:VacJ family lipoprotein [Pseudoroseicyclus sp. CXY001]|uniref:MlaA family lipoprotein n=1 Tax=Pseudoroseicyclus sp. CXY001 TaxID=3242492 RepID=UPI0035715E41